jgi:hypothetical protein
MLKMRAHTVRKRFVIVRKRPAIAGTAVILVGVLLAVLLLVPSSKRASAQATAQSLCQQYGLPMATGHTTGPVTLSSSYLVTAAQAAAWDKSQYAGSAPPPSPFASLPPNQELAVCYFSGTFDVPGGERLFNTYVDVVTLDGRVTFDNAGPAHEPFGPPSTVPNS